jgi:hypothetical protein
MAQVDVTPATGPAGLNLHFHGPAGASASQFNNPADFPVSKNGASTVVKIAPANGGPRFANPA